MKTKRFVKTYSDHGTYTIIVDRETGVNYLLIQRGYAATVTPLLNRDGTPVITDLNIFEED